METHCLEWKILFVDDDEDDYVLTREMLSKLEDHVVTLEWAKDYQEGLQKLSEQNWDTVLVDYDLGSVNGVQLIREAVSTGVSAPLIMVTGRGKYEVDVEAMQAGAYDYLSKADLSPTLLERVIRYARERQRSEEILELRVKERTEELQAALEELQVMEEELRVQLDETLKSQEVMAAIYKGYQDLFEFAPSTYLVSDRFGVILEANSAATRLFRNEKRHLVGKPLRIFISEDQRRDFSSKVNQLNAMPGIQQWDTDLLPFTKEAIHVHLVSSPVRGVDGKVITIRWMIYTV